MNSPLQRPERSLSLAGRAEARLCRSLFFYRYPGQVRKCGEPCPGLNSWRPSGTWAGLRREKEVPRRSAFGMTEMTDLGASDGKAREAREAVTASCATTRPEAR